MLPKVEIQVPSAARLMLKHLARRYRGGKDDLSNAYPDFTLDQSVDPQLYLPHSAPALLVGTQGELVDISVDQTTAHYEFTVSEDHCKGHFGVMPALKLTELSGQVACVLALVYSGVERQSVWPILGGADHIKPHQTLAEGATCHIHVWYVTPQTKGINRQEAASSEHVALICVVDAEGRLVLSTILTGITVLPVEPGKPPIRVAI